MKLATGPMAIGDGFGVRRHAFECNGVRQNAMAMAAYVIVVIGRGRGWRRRRRDCNIDFCL